MRAHHPPPSNRRPPPRRSTIGLLVLALALLGVVLTPSAEAGTTDVDLTVSSDLPSARHRTSNLGERADIDVGPDRWTIADPTSTAGYAPLVSEDDRLRVPHDAPPAPAPLTAPTLGPDSLRGPPNPTT